MTAGRDVIAALVAGTYPDPDRPGAPISIPIRSVAIEPSLDGREVDLMRELDIGDAFVIVSDRATHDILGARVERNLASAFTVDSVVLGDGEHPDEDTLARVAGRVPDGTAALVAIGAGTINDLCKKAAADRDIPYVVFGTAPSVNGYASPTSSITVAGLKSSLSARPPIGVFMDLGVMAGAPKPMIRAGLGECVCRPTAQSDWLLAHLVRDEPFLESPFEITRAEEDTLLDHADALVAGDIEMMGVLARSLVLAGIGMTIAGGSKSISQGEHLISHYLDMTRPADERGPLHGEQVGLCALVMARLQRRVLDLECPPAVHETRVTQAELRAHWGDELGDACWAQLERKRLSADDAEALTARLAGAWDELRARVEAASVPAARLEDALTRAGAPTRPDALGVADELFARACRRAREIRSRYTFLDLAADADIAIL